jgi:hypothetical protein
MIRFAPTTALAAPLLALGLAGPAPAAADELTILSSMPNLAFPFFVHMMKEVKAEEVRHPRPLVVAVNPMPYGESRYWPTSNRPLYELYVDRLSEFAEWLRRTYAVASRTRAICWTTRPISGSAPRKDIKQNDER